MDGDRCLAHKSYFIDIDGTIFPHMTGNQLNDVYKTEHISGILPGVVDYWNNIIMPEDIVVFTTARPQKYRQYTERNLKFHGLRYNHLLMDLGTGSRTLINDISPEQSVKAIGINVPRNGGLEHLL